MTVEDVSRLMNKVWLVCSAANALTSSGCTYPVMQAIINDLYYKLGGDEE